MAGRRKLTDAEREERRMATIRRHMDSVRGMYAGGRHALFEEGADPVAFADYGDDRRQFNLGDGAHHIQALPRPAGEGFNNG